MTRDALIALVFTALFVFILVSLIKISNDREEFTETIAIKE